jgi:predicted aspartyl protease
LADCQFRKVASPKVLISGNVIYIPTKINDQDVLFALDTGTNLSYISPDTAKTLGLTVFQLPGVQAMGSVGHQISGGRVQLDRWTVDRFSTEDLGILVVRKGGSVTDSGRPSDSLGMDFLGQFDVEIDE